MKVKLIAHTMLAGDDDGEIFCLEEFGYSPHYYDYPDSGVVEDADELAEFAGRACYESFERPNPATYSNPNYLAHILELEHESVLEHASATFYITGVSRSLTHELIRHRHLSYSQLSQRYVANDGELVVPPALNELPFPDQEEAVNLLVQTGMYCDESYDRLVVLLESNGFKRKEAREAARAVLPNMTETRIVVTGNHRAWRDVISKRYHPAADKEIQELGRLLLIELKKIAPNTYQEMAVEL